MILALWCFARGSRRFHGWLYNHRVFGPPLRLWEERRVIPPIAKILSVGFMLASLIYMFFYSGAPWYATAVSLPVIAYAVWFILSKPSR